MLPTMTLDEIRERLQALQDNDQMITKGAYSPTAVDLPDGILPFVELHMAYLRTHKNVNPAHYLSNLNIMLRVR